MNPPAIRVIGRKTGQTYDVSSMEDLLRLIRDGELDKSVFGFWPSPVDEWQPEWEHDFPKPGHTFPRPGLKDTEPFFLAYGSVTEAIRKYYRQFMDARLLLEFMIEAFFDEYERWNETHPDDFAREYLAAWHRGSKGRAYRLIGQAYLHITWDLPRVVEQCFPFGETEKLRISEGDAIAHFRGTNGLFLDVLYDNLKNYKVSGMFAPGGKLIEKRSYLLNSVFTWIIAIRMDAWALGCSLAKQTAAKRRELLNIQKRLIMDAASEATEGRFGWLALIKPPAAIFALAPVFLLSERARSVLLFLLALLLVAILNYASNATYRTLRIAERFAYRLHEEMRRLINSARETEIRRNE
jgi:hypothetical protein